MTTAKWIEPSLEPVNAQQVIVVVQLRPDANHQEEFLQTLFDVVERSRIAPGCLCHELFTRVDDENTVFRFQMWSTREAFEQNWLYTDLPRINTNSHLLAAAGVRGALSDAILMLSFRFGHLMVRTMAKRPIV